MAASWWRHTAEIHASVIGDEKTSLFGTYRSLNPEKVAALPQDKKQVIEETQDLAKKSALKTVALFPIGMLLAYLLLIGYFQLKGGYKPVELQEQPMGANGH